MLEWLKWLIAKKEMNELERWRLNWEDHRRWLAEFPEVGQALDSLKMEVDGTAVQHVMHLRDQLRK